MFINFKSPLARQISVVLAANLSLVTFGMNVVWGSPMLIKLRDENQTILSRPINLTEESLIVSTGHFVSIPTLILISSFGDYIGRKLLLCLTVIPKLMMQIMVIFATEVWMVICGRAISGIGDAVILGVISTYTSELSGKEIRGASGTMTQVLSATGMLLMLAIGPFVSYLTINIIVLCIIIVTYIPIMFIPESPYFLYTKGKTEKSFEVLTYLYGTKELAHQQIQLYKTEQNIESKVGKSVESKLSEKPSKWILVKDLKVLKSLAITLFISIGTQLTGATIINLYLQTVFELAHTSLSSQISSLIIGFIQLFACSVTLFITDRFGRKPILCTSLIGMAFGMFGLATFMQLINLKYEVAGFFNYLPITSVALAIYAYNAGLGSLVWILIAELLDSSLRSVGMFVSVLIAYVVASSMSLVFPMILDIPGGSSIVFWVFGGFCMFFCVFIAIFVPETKGKTFVEIQRAFGRKIVDSQSS